MKKTPLIMAFLSLQIFIFAQTASTVTASGARQEGVISFEEKVNMHKMIKDDAMKAYVPEFRTSKMELYFKGDECLYKPVEDDDEAEQGGGGGGPRMMIRRPQAEIYRNFATEVRVEQREAMGKKYLIEDSIKIRAWKMTGETRKILNYDCMKATFNDTARKQNMVVWFTDGIALSAGPGSMGSLPGMILAADMNDGEMVWTATKVEFKKVKPEDVKVPSKGEKIKEEDFRKKMDEFRQKNGGGNIRIMRN